MKSERNRAQTPHSPNLRVEADEEKTTSPRKVADALSRRISEVSSRAFGGRVSGFRFQEMRARWFPHAREARSPRSGRNFADEAGRLSRNPPLSGRMLAEKLFPPRAAKAATKAAAKFR